jgi:hypothetical protein
LSFTQLSVQRSPFSVTIHGSAFGGGIIILGKGFSNLRRLWLHRELFGKPILIRWHLAY